MRIHEYLKKFKAPLRRYILPGSLLFPNPNFAEEDGSDNMHPNKSTLRIEVGPGVAAMHSDGPTRPPPARFRPLAFSSRG